MYKRKVYFTALTMPALVFMQQAADYQKRRSDDKLAENERRDKLFKSEPVDITPRNRGGFPWSEKGVDMNKFEQEWSMKPVTVKGIFDHTKELKVEKIYRGEKGVQIITPFYTHVDKNGQACAILVNRGWVPDDLRGHRMHYTDATMATIQGVLYRGDNKTKYSRPNDPTNNMFYNVTPYDFSVIDQLPNQDEAAQFMLRIYDHDSEARQILPSAPAQADFFKYTVSPERHQAYEGMWRMLAFGGVVANAAMWLAI